MTTEPKQQRRKRRVTAVLLLKVMTSAQASRGPKEHPAPRSILLPYATLQPTYSNVYSDIATDAVAAENVWLSVYADNAPSKSIHATLTLAAKEKNDPADPDEVACQLLKGGMGVLGMEEVQSTTQGSKGKGRDLRVWTGASVSAQSPTKLQNHPQIPSTQPITLRLPILSYSALLKGRRSERALERGGGGTIGALGISPQGSHFVIGGEDGEAVVGGLPSWLLTSRDEPGGSEVEARGTNASQGGSDEAMESVEERAQRRLKDVASRKAQSSRMGLLEHVGDVHSAKFFPSGQVVLTAASDLRIRLYSITSPSPVRTFTGHKRAITSLAMLGRGRRIISGSLDGTIKIWDVAAERCIRTMAVRRMSGVESLVVLPVAAKASSNEEEEGMGEYLVFAGLSNGWIEVFSLRLELLEASRPAGPDEETEPGKPAEIRVQDFSVAQVAPIRYPSDLPEGRDTPGATDFWHVVDTGAVWSIDVSVVASSSKGYIVAGTKAGVLRLFSIDVESLSAYGERKRHVADSPDQLDADAVMSANEEEVLERTASPLEVVNIRRNSAGINAVRFLNQKQNPGGGAEEADGDQTMGNVSGMTASSAKSSHSSGPPDVVVATSDGTPYRLGFSSASPAAADLSAFVVCEYTGWEAGDSVEDIALVHRHQPQQQQQNAGGGEAAQPLEPRVLLAGAEGCLRVY